MAGGSQAWLQHCHRLLCAGSSSRNTAQQEAQRSPPSARSRSLAAGLPWLLLLPLGRPSAAGP